MMQLQKPMNYRAFVRIFQRLLWSDKKTIDQGM